MPFGNYNMPLQDKYYGDGVLLENGFRMLSYGGGCSGDDCNTTFIIDDKGNLIASKRLVNFNLPYP